MGGIYRPNQGVGWVAWVWCMGYGWASVSLIPNPLAYQSVPWRCKRTTSTHKYDYVKVKRVRKVSTPNDKEGGSPCTVRQRQAALYVVYTCIDDAVVCSIVEWVLHTYSSIYSATAGFFQVYHDTSLVQFSVYPWGKA